MKRFAIAAAVLMLGVSASAQTIASKKIENGGTGRYKAIVTTETGLENFTVYRPENMFTAANSEGKLPVILFGNGGCADSSEGFENFLTEIASHGYVVVSIDENMINKNINEEGKTINTKNVVFQITKLNEQKNNYSFNG
mgnify:CR=1 FL=1